ncbi:AhpC/TSA family protein [Haloechinothrix sp. YIM 98757]|uniref:AhpC/TSA family protein n=1 Tax=Haloechinothrix aidingensis TaxID=2752311 RepID=A0A838AAF7_9PSEU|nr:peroxiredoxin-like family protein [Haloechinothrix aidingensis]MBA0126206.1 AhpC/TSA family protein [Haloechinothrix aidingensis]
MPLAGSTARVSPGEVVEPRALTTINSQPVRVPAADALTHLQFRRFAACPICNIHLRSVARRHDEIVDAGVREVAVFHSPVEAMLPYQGEFPFAVLADPDRELYSRFGVESSPKSNLHPRAWSTPLKWRSWSVVVRAVRAGGKVGPQGESMTGLPADFLIDSGGRVLAAKYGSHANDQWSVDELLRLARTARKP